MIYITHLLFSSLIGLITGVLYGILFSEPLTSLYKTWQPTSPDDHIELTQKNKIRLILQAIFWFFLRYIIIGLSLFFLLVKVRVNVAACLLFFCLGFWLYILKSTKAY